MYNGEVHIFQEELDRFLSIAQRLKLEGLLVDGSESGQQQSTPNETNKYFEPSEPIIEKNPATTLSNLSSKIISLSNTEDNEVSSMISDNLEELDGRQNARCKICGKDPTGMKKSQKACLKINMRNHVETHVEGLSFSCQICGKEFRSKNSFSVHKSIFQKNK